jgi:hypothetical protein
MQILERTGVTSLLLKAVYYVASLIAIPIQVSNIGLEKFGYLSLILSVSILMPLIELGTGFPIQNILTDKVLKSTSESLEFLVKIIRLYLAISMTLLSTYFLFVILTHSNSLVAESVSEEVSVLLFLIISSLILNLFANLAFRYLMAVGEGFRATVAQNLGLIFGVTSTSALTFVTDSILLLVTPVFFIPSLTILLVFFSSNSKLRQIRKIKNLVKTRSYRADSDGLRQKSLTYVTLNLGNILSLHFGGVIVAISLNPADLGRYYVVWKFVTFFSSLITALYSIQWSDYRKKYKISGSKYRTEVVMLHRYSILLGIVSVIPIQALSPKALEIWSNGKVLIDSRISLILTLYIVVFAASYPINMYFNVIYSRQVLLGTGLLTNVMNILLTTTLLTFTNSYISPILGSLLAIALFTYIPQLYIFKWRSKSFREI